MTTQFLISIHRINMQKQLLLFLSLLSISYLSISKPTKEIQIGLTYNTFKWKINSGIQPLAVYKYNRFYTSPLIRFSITSKYKKNFALNTFIGYHTMGGKFKSDTSNFKEKIIHHSLETGILPTYKFLKNTSIGIGLKLNYNPLTLYKYHGTIYQSDTIPRKWFTENISERYKKISTNIGFNAKHQYNRFSFSFEAWFGLTNLGNLNSITYKSKIIESNYRMLIGYKISKQDKK